MKHVKLSDTFPSGLPSEDGLVFDSYARLRKHRATRDLLAPRSERAGEPDPNTGDTPDADEDVPGADDAPR